VSFGGAPEGSSGFMYFWSIHCGLGRGPIDELREIRMGGKLGWQGNLSVEQVVQINAPQLFGGNAKEGGVVGNLHYLPGGPTQVIPESLATVLISPSTVTDFRRMVTIFFDGMISALNPYPKTWSWRIRRAINGWDGDTFRPDLAIITLMGQTIPPAADNRPLVRGDRTRAVPMVNTVNGTLDSMFGLPIEQINEVLVNVGTVVDPVYKPVGYAYDVISPNQWLIKIPAVYRGLPVLIRYFNGSGASLFNRAQLSNDGFTTTTTFSILEFATGPGTTVISITSLLCVALPPPMGYFPIPFTIVVNDPDHCILHIPAMYLNRVITVNYTRTGGGSFQQFITPVRLLTPAIVDLDLNPGETLVSLIPVTKTVSAPGVDEPPREIYSEIVDIDLQLVAVHDIEVEGQEVYIPFLYKPNLGIVNYVPDPVIKAMNPAHMLFECLTNREWGRGRDRASLSISSFEAAAQTLYNEGFGLCIAWKRRDSIKTFMQYICDHIGAVLYTDRSTALITLLLIRGDYTKAELKLWDTSIEIKESTVNTASMLINEVVVTWHDPVFNEDRWVGEQNLANLQATQGAVNSLKKDYKGLPTAGLARRVALRDLKAQSQGLRRFQIVLDRRAWNMTPGKVMRIQDVSRGIPDIVVRLATFKDGTLQNGRITVDAVQDIFTFPAAGFTQEQPPHWNETDNTPCIGEHEVFEVPYYMLVRGMRPADFALLTDSSSYLGTVAEKGQTINTDYAIAVRNAAPTPDDVPLLADQLYCGYSP